MKRFVLAIVAVGALNAPAMAANCAKDYKDFWQNLDRGDAVIKISAAMVRNNDPVGAILNGELGVLRVQDALDDEFAGPALAKLLDVVPGQVVGERSRHRQLRRARVGRMARA